LPSDWAPVKAAHFSLVSRTAGYRVAEKQTRRNRCHRTTGSVSERRLLCLLTGLTSISPIVPGDRLRN
jgi:hypothetical protein